MKFTYLIACLLICSPGVQGQPDLDLPRVSTEVADSPSTATRELRVLSPTLAPEQIDRAVLNRLFQEILDDPQAIADLLGVDAIQLQDIQTVLSNAHGFINDNDMANINAMCAAWKNSDRIGIARIEEALTAYNQRAQFTRDFIAQYYGIVLTTIEQQLDTASLNRFNSYMTDRRRRMANTGATTLGSVSHNVRSGEESIRFHCRAE